MLLRLAIGTSLLLAACSGAPGTSTQPIVHGDPNDPNSNPPTCGVGPLPTQGDTAKVMDDGTVVFDPVAVGSTATFAIPVKESADTDETIVAANATNGAFEVLSPLPIYVPRGTAVSIEVSFTPQASGAVSADLVLGTAKMGNSHVALEGAGL